MKKSLIVFLLIATVSLCVVIGATALVLETTYERGLFFDQTTPSGETYDLMVPTSASPFRKAPLIVMLHGGTQTAEELAALTAMNVHAEAFGFLVLYPKQSENRNPEGYWNWFLPENQIRFGEPALIVEQISLVRDAYAIDPSAIFAAGFSAGACMALNLAVAYPDVISGVGLVGGLAYGVATSAIAAFAAMSGTLPDLATTSHNAFLNRPETNRAPLRAIVFHGTADTRVAAENQAYLLAQIAQINDWIDDALLNQSIDPQPAEAFDLLDEDQVTSWYQSYLDASGRAYLVGYLIEGMAHRWPGGTDSPFGHPLGPDASLLMIRFFLAT